MPERDLHDEAQRARRDGAEPSRSVMTELRDAVRIDPDHDLAAQARALLAVWEERLLERKAARRAEALAQAKALAEPFAQEHGLPLDEVLRMSPQDRLDHVARKVRAAKAAAEGGR